MNSKIFITVFLIFILLWPTVLPITAQVRTEVFDKVELLVPNGDKVDEKSVRISFLADSLKIETTGKQKIVKIYKYSDILNAEYSYSKNPRWKTGLGLGAASILFPPLIFIAVPLGFSKHRRHWLTIRTSDDYAVLKLSKQNRKLILPAFETRTGVDVKGEGEDK